MSLSKCYPSTPETTNTARLARLILGPCADVLREILKKEVSPSDLSKEVKKSIDKMKKQGFRNPLNLTQSEIIFPKPTKQYSGNYSDLDISLLYLLLRNVSKIAPHSKGWGEIPDPGDRSVAANIERIRLIRNQYYGHSADLSLSESDFRQEWRNIRDIVVELERHLGTTTVYQDSVNEIKTCSMDPEQEKKYIDLLGDIRELHTTVDVLSNKIQIIQDSALHRDLRVARKIETTKQMISEHYEAMNSLFVKTRAFDEAKKLLDANGYVVIKGNPGTGKTTIAKMLMKELIEKGKSPLQLFKFSELYDTISRTDGIIVFFDNVFGELSLSNNDVQEFTTRAELIKILIERDTENNSNSMIFTIRNDVYHEFISQRKNEIFFQSSLIDICSSDYALQEQEMTLLLQKYNLPKGNSNTDIVRKVSEIPLSIGFPQCCKLASTNAEISNDIEHFMLNPRVFLKEYFEELLQKNPVKSAVLVYILFSGGKVDLNYIESIHKDLELKRASLKYLGLHSSKINNFQRNIFCFEGFLTIRDAIEHTYKFSHSSVQETLFNVIFYFDPSNMIQNCHYSLLNMLTTNEKPNNIHVVIGQDLFVDVACRLANIIESQSAEGYSSISFLELWNDSNFYENILLTKQFILKIEACRDINEDSMIVHFSKAGERRWVEYLLPNSDKKQRYRSLNAACSTNKSDIVHLILSSDVKCDLQTCFYAVQSGNLELLLRVCELVDLHQRALSLHPVWSFLRHSLLQEICLMRQTQFIEPILSKYPFLVNIKNDQGSNALQSVASSGDKHAFNLLLNFGFDPYEKDRYFGHTVFTCACRDGRLEMVKYLIEKYPAMLHHHTDLNERSLLYWAAFCGKINMFEYILNLYVNRKIILPLTSSIEETIYRKDKSGLSILHAACENGQLDMCKYLLNIYPQLLNASDNEGMNVLHSAALGGNISLFQYLLKKGLDIYSTTNSGMNLLHICCARSRKDLCYYLVNAYPDFIHAQDKNGMTVLHAACFGGNIGIVAFLISKGLDIGVLSNDDKSILHTACLSGKYEICEYLIENQPQSVNGKDKFNYSVLHYAACGGNVQIVKLLIEKGMNVSIVSNNGETILHYCCRFGKTEMCEYLVNQHSELLQLRDKKGWTVLHSACFGGSVEMVSFLIKKGLDSNAFSNDGKSILHIAGINGKYDVCEYLIESYPQLLNTSDKINGTILHHAACEGNMEIVKMLLEKGMDIKSLAYDGKSILHNCFPIINIQMFKYLVNHHSDLLEIRDNNGWTVLHSACLFGNVEIVSFLIENGSDINVLSNDGKCILHMACFAGKYDICEFIVEKYPELLDMRDNINNSVLHDAAWGGNVQILKFLIIKGCDIKSVTANEETILHLCCRSEKKEMSEYIVKHFSFLMEKRSKSGYTVLHSACQGGSVEIVSFLIKKGLDTTALSKEGASILHVACFYGNYKVCEYLVENYLELLEVRDKNQNSVLHNAAVGGSIIIVEFLIKKGMDIKSVSANNMTVLHQCFHSGKIEMCKYLINKYPELLEIRDIDGCTALHSACRGGNVGMVSFLIKKGLDVSELLKGGQSNIHIACLHGKRDVFEYLVDNYPQLLDIKDKDNHSVLHCAGLGGNVQIVKTLIEKGLDIKSVSKYGKTILHYCCLSSNLEMCKFVVNYCLELLEMRDIDGWTCLHEASKGGSVKIVSFLIKKGMNINTLTMDGKSVLHIACVNWKYELMEYLVNNYPQLLDVMDKFNISVLHQIAWEGNVQILRLLIGKGMKTESVCINGETILHKCCRSGKLEMCKYLVNHYSALLEKTDNNGWTALYSACFGGSVEMFSFLVMKCLDINALSNDGGSILHFACNMGKFDICEFLVMNYPHLLDVRDECNMTVLHRAALGGNVQIIKMLIDNGIDIHSVTKSGETILHKSCRSGNLEFCEYMINNYSELLEIRNNMGWTVLHVACFIGAVEIVSLLVQKGLDISALTNDRQSILHIACSNGKVNVCRYLLTNFPHLLDVKDIEGKSVKDISFENGDVDIINLLKEHGVNQTPLLGGFLKRMLRNIFK